MLDSGKESRHISISFRQKHILLCLISQITWLIPAVSRHENGLSAEVCELMHASGADVIHSLFVLSSRCVFFMSFIYAQNRKLELVAYLHFYFFMYYYYYYVS